MTSRGKKILLGILAVFGVGVLLLVVAVITFVVWISTPGELIEPERLLSAGATGYAEWTLREEDPGTEGFLRLLSDAGRDFSSQVDTPFPGFGASWSNDSLTDLLPAVVAWTLHPPGDTGTEDLQVLSVSAERLGNQIVLADWIAGFAISRSRDPNVGVERYNNENIYRLRQPRGNMDVTLFVRRGAVFVASDMETAHRTVDLLADGELADASDAPRRAPTRLDELFARTSADAALRAAVTNRTGELARLWAAVSSTPVTMPDAWNEVQGIALSGGLQADGSFAGTLRLQLADPAAAAAYVPALPTVVGLQLGSLDTRIEIASEAVEEGVRMSFTIPGLVEDLSTLLGNVNRGRRDF